VAQEKPSQPHQGPRRGWVDVKQPSLPLSLPPFLGEKRMKALDKQTTEGSRFTEKHRERGKEARKGSNKKNSDTKIYVASLLLRWFFSVCPFPPPYLPFLLFFLFLLLLLLLSSLSSSSSVFSSSPPPPPPPPPPSPLLPPSPPSSKHCSLPPPPPPPSPPRPSNEPRMGAASAICVRGKGG